MIPIVMSASAYEKNELACLQQLTHIIQHSPPVGSTVLVADTLLPNTTIQSHALPSIYRFHLSDWLKINDIPRKTRIRHAANKLSRDHVVILDARQYDPADILPVLHDVSQIWFHLSEWQPAFVLIVDDYYCLHFMRELSTTFYIQPLSTSKQSIQSELRIMHMRIRLLRWLGFSRLSRFCQTIFSFLQKLKCYVKRKCTK